MNNSNFTCMSGNDGGGGSVSINFVKSLSSLKIPMRCTIDHAMHIVCYSQSQYNNCIAQHIRYIYSKIQYIRKNNPFCCTCESVCCDLLVSPECRQPEKTSRSKTKQNSSSSNNNSRMDENNVAEMNVVQRNLK